MTTPIFFTQSLKCPKCKVSQNYYTHMPDIVCDYCLADIKIKGEFVQIV